MHSCRIARNDVLAARLAGTSAAAAVTGSGSITGGNITITITTAGDAIVDRVITDPRLKDVIVKTSDINTQNAARQIER